jgi:hypothetical protein
MKCSVFWDITPCCPLTVNRHFGGTRGLHLEGGKIREARNQCEEVPSVKSACALGEIKSNILQPELENPEITSHEARSTFFSLHKESVSTTII